MKPPTKTLGRKGSSKLKRPGHKRPGGGAAPAGPKRGSYSARLIAKSVEAAKAELTVEDRTARESRSSVARPSPAEAPPGVRAPRRGGSSAEPYKPRPIRIRGPRGPQLVDKPTHTRADRGGDSPAERATLLRQSGRMRPQSKPGRTTLQRLPTLPATGRPAEPMRIAKAMARAGLCSRRDAERWIEDGRVSVNGRVLTSPATDVTPRDVVTVDGQPMPAAEPARIWRYHKPKGLVTTHSDPEGRTTVFETLPPELPRVVSIGRLDYNSEGLLLLTNDGELARHLELPTTGWLRRYRVRAYGRLTQSDLDPLKDGITVGGVAYGPIEATLDSVQSGNMWLTLGLREGKNREVRKILGALGLEVNRLIRISFGPFQLLDLEPGAVEHVRRRVLGDQLGPELAKELGFDTDLDTPAEPRQQRSFQSRREPERRPEASRPKRNRSRPESAPPGRREQRTPAPSQDRSLRNRNPKGGGPGRRPDGARPRGKNDR